MTENRDDMTTQPTLTTLLERVQKSETGLYQAIEQLGLRIEGQIQSVRRELHDEAESLREEMRTQFRKLETKFQLLIEDSMDVRANQRDLSKRMDELDVKAS
jgi:hypothetical protein